MNLGMDIEHDLLSPNYMFYSLRGSVVQCVRTGYPAMVCSADTHLTIQAGFQGPRSEDILNDHEALEEHAQYILPLPTAFSSSGWALKSNSATAGTPIYRLPRSISV